MYGTEADIYHTILGCSSTVHVSTSSLRPSIRALSGAGVSQALTIQNFPSFSSRIPGRMPREGELKAIGSLLKCQPPGVPAIWPDPGVCRTYNGRVFPL
jgi:hypothetical protein